MLFGGSERCHAHVESSTAVSGRQGSIMIHVGGRSLQFKFCAAVLAVFTIHLSTVQGALSQGATIKIINPSPPGGTADAVARLISEYISRNHGVGMVVESRPGAGTAIGTEAVSRATPDGNTLLISSPAIILNQHVRKLNYSLSSFEPICNLTQSPQLIAVNSASPYRTMADLFNSARAKPGELTLASTGPATQSQIGFEHLKRVHNLEMTYVPFPGNAPTVNALLGAHVTAGIANYADFIGHFRSGSLRPLATTTPARIEPLPDLPTVAESGHKELEYELWFGVFAPVKTPPHTVSKLANWFNAAIQEAEVRTKLMAQGLYPVGMCGADFAALLRKENDEYSQIIRETDFKLK